MYKISQVVPFCARISLAHSARAGIIALVKLSYVQGRIQDSAKGGKIYYKKQKKNHSALAFGACNQKLASSAKNSIRII